MKYLSALFVSALLTVPAFAQDIPDLPIIISRYEDPMLYTYANGELQPMTYCLPEGETALDFPIALAPDGKHFAFLAEPPLLPEDYNGPGLGFTDIWICDVAGQRVTRIAGQPDDAQINPDDFSSSVYAIHSLPSWSPDGTLLAWNQVAAPENTPEVVVYDTASGAARTVYERDPQPSAVARDLMPAGIEWGQGGIAIYDYVSSRITIQSVTFIDPDTGAVNTVQLDGSLFGDIMRWALDGQQPVFVITRVDAALIIVSPNAGGVSEMNGSNIEYYSLFAPDTSLRLFGYQAGYPVWAWSVAGDTADSSFQYPTGVVGTVENVALSPDGQQVAFITFEDYPFGGKAYIRNGADFAHSRLPVERIEEVSAFYSQPGALRIYWAPLGARVVRY